ncbi:MAG: hypothetical protein WBK20_13630 [Spirochaetota bacterium]
MNGEDVNNNKTGNITRSLVLKVVLVAFIVFFVLWLIFNIKDYGKVNLVISNEEIVSNDQISLQKFTEKDKIYFFIDRVIKPSLDCNTVSLVIDYYENNSFTQYKQITFEVDKNFKYLSTYIPREYFKRNGKYQLKVLLDGKLMATREFEVEK